MWNALYTAEKVIIRWTLLTEACYFTVQFLGEWLQPPGAGGCKGWECTGNAPCREGEGRWGEQPA